MKRFLVPLALAAALAAPTTGSAAERRAALGLGLGIVDPEDLGATLWSTVNFRLPLGSRLYLEPEAGFWKKSEDIIVNQEGTEENFSQAKVYGGLRIRF